MSYVSCPLTPVPKVKAHAISRLPRHCEYAGIVIFGLPSANVRRCGYGSPVPCIKVASVSGPNSSISGFSLSYTYLYASSQVAFLNFPSPLFPVRISGDWILSAS